MTVIKRLLSTASAITLCTSLLLTAPAYANYAANNESAPEASVVCEDTSQRTAFSKHFLLDDGSYVAVSYPEAVHIKTDDGWEEIDNSLSADKNGTITNKNPAFPVAFNNTVSNSVSMGANDNRISWSLKAETKTSSVNADISRGITGNVIKHTADEVAAAGSILYENIFSGTQNVSVRYTVMHNKVEEDILLAEPGNITAFSMDVYAPGMTAIVNNDNTVTICNSSEVLYRISAPYMCDAADAVLNDFNVTVAYTADGFKITYNPADGWLNDSARVYPVLFDPAITTSEYKSGMIDTYVMEGNTAAHNSEQKLYAGIKNGKLCRTYLKFTSLPAIPDNMPITGAKLFVLNTNGSTTGRRFGLYKVQSSWNPDTITYSNQPSIGRLLDTDDFDASDLTNCFSLSDDLNSFYTEYFAGSNFGYMLRYTDESTTNPDYNAFYSTENTTRANRPYIKIYYGYSMPTCLSANAVYSIKNAASGKYLSVFNGTDANGTNVCQLAQNNGTSQQFKLELTSEGACVLRAKCSSNGSGRVLDIAKSGGYVQNGCNVQLYNKVDAIAQEWLILAVGSGFRIVPRTNMSLALTSYGSANGTADGKSATSAGNVYVGNYTGSLNQVWYFYNKNGEQITPESFPGLQPDDYYFNNASTGAFIKRLNSDVIPMAGSLSMLGDSIKWRTESIGNGEYVIRLAADPTLYLKGSTSLPDGSGGPVSLQSITSGNVPSICRWRVEYDDGLIIINASTGYYLCCTSGTLGTVSSKYATNYKWRRVPASQYGTTSSFIMRELESVTMDSFLLGIGLSGLPNVKKHPANALWADVENYIYSSSSNHVSITNGTHPSITAVSLGTATITATHKVTGKTAAFTVTSIPWFYGKLLKTNDITPSDLQHTNDGFWMCTKSIADIMYRHGMRNTFIYNDNINGIQRYFDDWYVYSISQDGSISYGLFKMREDESSTLDNPTEDAAHARPEAAISFINYNALSLINCTVSTNETTQRAAEYEIEACTNVNKNRKHDPVLKTYFSNPASDGSYLISEYYVRFLAKLHSETGYIPATNAYNAIIHEIEQIREALTTIVDSDIEIELNNRLNQLERIPNALAEINARAGYNIFRNNRIYFSDCNNLTYDEQCAILAMHSANVNYYSFAAEVLAHAAVLSTALPDSTYKCALIANMGLGEETDSGVLDQAYYNLNSPLVKDQVKYHENRYN